MSFVVKGGGSSNWSDIVIDADKDMLGFGLSNMKEVAAAMIGGDLIARGLGGILVRIPAGIANTVLTSTGIGLVPTWAPGGLYLNRYLPVTIGMAGYAAAVFTPTHTDDEGAIPITTGLIAETGDDVANWVSLLAVSLALTDAQTVPFSATHTNNENCPIGCQLEAQQVLDGAVADDGGATTDETAAAKNATANDMTLTPAAPANNDAYYFGSDYVFDNLLLNIGTAGVGVWTYVWEYYDVDTTWHALAGVVDETAGFLVATTGIKTVQFTNPGAAWGQVAIGGVGPLYWIRCRIVAFTSIATQPLGTQSWYRLIQ